MNLFPRFPWRALLLLVMVPVVMTLAAAPLYFAAYPVPPIANPFYRPVLAAEDAPVEACEPWKSAGGQIIYRCVDEDVSPYAVCYLQGLMLFCLPQE